MKTKIRIEEKLNLHFSVHLKMAFNLVFSVAPENSSTEVCVCVSGCSSCVC